MNGPKVAIALTSLGIPGIHGISQRLSEAARHGITGVEIVDDDIDSFAVQLAGGTAMDENRLIGARIVKKACDNLGLTVITLQPFRHYEGLIDRTEHEKMMEKLDLWFKICKILGTTIIQVASNWLAEGTTAHEELVVRDLVKLADRGLAETPVIHFAYEAVAWGTHFNLWQDSWELTKKVNRPNFGLCLDTFHIAGRVYGDALSPSGKSPDADADIEDSMRQFVAEVDVDKIFYVQVGDAERLHAPLDSNHIFYHPQQQPRMSWSRNARIFPCEEELGAYLPIERIVRAIVCELGYKGWLSLELFNRDLRTPDPELPAKYAARAARSWERLSRKLGIAPALNYM